MKKEIIRLQNVTKKIGDVTYLDNINLHIYKGEIMGLFTLNTLGKEELLDILLSRSVPNRGKIYFEEELLRYNISNQSMHNKVYMIEKTSKLSRNLTVADNIFVMRRGFKKYIIQPRVLNAQAQLFLKEIKVDIRAQTRAEELSPLERCIVEIIKAAAMGARLIILNDVSAFLSAAQWNRFFEVVNIYRNKGFSFLCVESSHDALLRTAGRIALMRNGNIIKVLDVDADTREKILPFIIEPAVVMYAGDSPVRQFPVLIMNEVTTDNLQGFSMQIYRGECVVITDLNNTIIQDFIQIFSGQLAIDAGSLELCGKIYRKKIRISSPIRHGVCVLNEHPTQSMLFRDLSYVENLCFVSDGKIRNLWSKRRVHKSLVDEYYPLAGENLNLTNITELDETGKYDLIYYRVHLLNPKLLICIQPFSGADMYLRSHITGLLNFLRLRGIAILILTVNPADTLPLADRLILVRNGKQTREYNRDAFSRIDPGELFFGNVEQK